MKVCAPWWIGGALVLAFGLASCERAGETPEASGDAVSSSVEGEGWGATAVLGSASLTMAEVARLELSVRVASEEIARIDIGFEVTDEWADVRRESSTGPKRSGASGTIAGSVLVLEPFLPGELRTPEIVLTPVLKNGGPGEALTIGPLTVEVVSVIEGDAEGAELADVKGVLEAPALSRTLLIVGIAGAGVGVLAGIIVLAVLMVRGREKLVQVRPAHEIALEALERLRGRGLVESGHMKEFYFELSRILRRYIEGRFGLHAPEQTTSEFLREARGCGALGTQDVELLERFLGHCDMVKFAKLEVVREQAETSLSTVKDFVERTRVSIVAGEVVVGSDGTRREAAA